MSDFVGKVSEKLKKLSDEQVERLISTIQEENDIFDSILESLSAGIVVVDKSWHVIKLNKAVKRLVPLVAHYKDRNDVFWNLIDDSDIAEFFSKTASDNNYNVSREFSLVSENSTSFIVISVLPLVKKKDIAGSIITISDMTAKRQQEILLHRMDSLQSLTNLAASVAHKILLGP